MDLGVNRWRVRKPFDTYTDRNPIYDGVGLMEDYKAQTYALLMLTMVTDMYMHSRHDILEDRRGKYRPLLFQKWFGM